MFRRERHRLVARILAAISNDVLERCSAGFGGGTRIALVLDEYRESHDVDFLCSDARGYAELRSLVRDNGAQALVLPAAGLGFPREPRIDQYGVRFPVVVDGVSIRFEIVSEGRIALGPFERPAGLPVPCLGREDCFAEKLLANSDRWADRDVLSRDLIDLAMLAKPSGSIPEPAMGRAEAAYGSVLRRDLTKARDAFLASAEHRERCFRGLGIENPGSVLAAVEQLSIGASGTGS
jgi:hypothetical protein